MEDQKKIKIETGPSSTGRFTHSNLGGMMIPYINEQPVILFVSGSKQHFLAVFKSVELLMETMQKGKQHFNRIKQIDADPTDFIQSLIDSDIGIQIMVNPKFNENDSGRMKYFQVDPSNLIFDDKPQTQ